MLLAVVEFEHPWRLVWLALAPLMVYFAFRSWTLASVRRRLASLVCRLLVLTLVVLAFAAPVRRGPGIQRMVVFATDVSPSAAASGHVAEQFLAAALREQAGHRAAFVAFAGRPGPVTDQPQLASEGLDPRASDPAAAVQWAAAAIPADFVPAVVLLTDGHQTHGDLLRAAVGTNVPVSVVPLPAFAAPEVCVMELVAPAEVAPGRDVPLEVVIQANVATPGRLELVRDGELVSQSDVELQIGQNRVPLQAPLGVGASATAERGVTFTARLTAEHDTMPENNQRRTWVAVGRGVQLLLVDTDPAAAAWFRELLRSQGAEVTVRAVADVPSDAEALDAFDALILSDVSSGELTASQHTAIDRYVHDLGGGLIVLGGDKTFGEAAFHDTPLERLLPVTAVAAAEAEKAVLALVLVIDRSGSMLEERRLELAKEAAKQSVQVLDPHDKAGLIAFSDDSEWIAPLTTVADKADLLQRIDTLTAYGQTNMYPGVMRAVLALEQTVADRRHIILLSDGVPSPGDYREIAARMADGGITLATVSLGESAEQEMLLEMAQIAGGRHHHCDDPADVPRILVQETQEAVADEGLREFRPFALRTLPGLDIASAPPLLGHARTNPKPEAEPLLFAAAGHPLLCWWRHGAGVTLAYTSDVKDRWAGPWHSWPGAGAFWKRVVRHTARHPRPRLLSMTASRRDDSIVVAVDLTSTDGQYDSGAQLVATLAEPGGELRTVKLEPAAPGRYTASFPISRQVPAEYEIRVRGDGSDRPPEAMQKVFIDYSDNLRLQPADEDLLRRVATATGGQFQPDPASVFAPDGRSVERIARLWSYLLGAALLLFVADVALRRWPFSRLVPATHRSSW